MDNDDSLLLLRAWAPITTRLLGGETANSSSWYVMDNVMEEPSFVEQLRQELERGGILQSMKSARTQGDVRTEQLMSLLQQTGIFAETDAAGNATSTNNTTDNIRGDKSTFVPRKLRQSANFATHYPKLKTLIQRIEHTAQRHLSHCLEFNFSMTSVQIAEFPGDASSGYPRHCDRQGNLCRQENNVDKTQDERLLTFVYYLTPDDWDPLTDGGSLRIFVLDHNNQNDKSSQQEFVDVPPYSNRAILLRSDGVEHEVRPSLRRPRLALTIWLYGKIKTTATVIKETGKTVNNNNGISETTGASTGNKDQAQGGRKSSNNQRPEHLSCKGSPPLSVLPTQSSEPQPTIFVSIAAYRDSETGPTLRSLAAMATHSYRVFVGLVLQLDSDHDQAIINNLPIEDPWYQSNGRCMNLEARHALGPCYARALCQSLYRGEDYVLQIDSHMRFRKNWDTYLIQELEELIIKENGNGNGNSEKVMLTTYPVGYQLPNQIPNETRGTLLVPWKFDDNGLLRQRGRLLQAHPSKPVPCHLYAAAFNFSRSDVLEDCPYDQSLHHLFFGEELSMAVRLYTHGYHLYAPKETVCYHLWSRSHRPTQSDDKVKANGGGNKEWHERRKRMSLEKVKQQLMGSDCDRSLGLGTARSHQDFASALGVDFGKGVIVDPDASLGRLRADDFAVATDVKYAPESLEGNVQRLDQKAKDLVASFLQQMQ